MDATVEQYRAELDANLEDFRAKSSAANVMLEHQEKSLTTIITSIGFILAATPFIIQFQVPIVLGVASFVFYALALTQIRYAWSVLGLNEYMARTIVPNIRSALTGMAPGKIRSFDHLMLWETSAHRAVYSPNMWLFPVEAARYGIPLVAGIVCCLGYLSIPTSQKSVLLDLVIVLLNIIAVAYVIGVGVWSRGRLLFMKNQTRDSDMEE